MVSLLDGTVLASNHEIYSSCLSLKGQTTTTLRFHEKEPNDEQKTTNSCEKSRYQQLHCLLKLRNVSLSVSDVTFDLHTTRSNGDVACASVTSSSVHITNCDFLLTGFQSIFVLEGSSESFQSSSSITLVGCGLDNSERHLTPIVEDIRDTDCSDFFNLDVVGTRITNTKVIGADGIGVTQTSKHKKLTNFEGITTTLSEMSFSNVSSLPGTVRQVSPSFSQRMIGSHIWGSNNHVSGSTLRDMNGGGGFLCTNTTFDWCHTTSSERPSPFPNNLLPPTRPSRPSIDATTNQEDSEPDPYTDQVYDGVERFYFHKVPVRFSNCSFTNMLYTVSYKNSGGSALCLYAPEAIFHLTDCQFIKCSVDCPGSVSAGCIFINQAGKVDASPNAIQNCLFQNWYPKNDANKLQFGGGVGIITNKNAILIIHSNFTLTESEAHVNNGGFISMVSEHSPDQDLTIDNCRFVGDVTSTGQALNITCSGGSVEQFSVRDSVMIDVNSEIVFKDVKLARGEFIRTTIANTSITIDRVTPTTQNSFLILDCKIIQTPLISSRSYPLLHLSGSHFTGTPTISYPKLITLDSISHVVFHGCVFSDCHLTNQQPIIIARCPTAVFDQCSFLRSSGDHGIFSFERVDFSFYFCHFSDLSAIYINFLESDFCGPSFFENCRFDLPPLQCKMDFEIEHDLFENLNASSVVGCTTNRPIVAGSFWGKLAELNFIAVDDSPVNKLRVGNWPTGQEQATEGSTNEEPTSETPIHVYPSLSAALATLSSSSLHPNIISLSDGDFSETLPIEIKHNLEIVGTGSNTSNFHVTTFKTAGITVATTLPFSLNFMNFKLCHPSSVLVTLETDGILNLKRTFVDGIVDLEAPLAKLTAGTTRIAHSTFQNLVTTDTLILVSGSASVTLSNTLFVTIARISSAPDPVGSTCCASCIEGSTSGAVAVLFSRFGVCTTNGRSGAIDLVMKNSSSSVEIRRCFFDQNFAGESVANSSRGDDLVLKGFDETQLALEMTTIQSFPTNFPMLINTTHPIVAPPALLQLSTTGEDKPLTWSDPNAFLSPSLLTKYTLQFLLEFRLRHNVHTTVSTNFIHKETMTPFRFDNSSVSINLSNQRGSVLTVNQQNTLFCEITTGTLTLYSLTLSFDSLTTSALTCDADSSLTLIAIQIDVADQIVRRPFVDSVGTHFKLQHLAFFNNISFLQTPFLQFIRPAGDAHVELQQSFPTVLTGLTSPFFVVEGASKFEMVYSYLYNSHTHSAPLIHASHSNIELSSITVGMIVSNGQGGFLSVVNCSVLFKSGNYSSCSASKGGVLFCVDSNINITTGRFISCEANQGGVLFSQNSNVTIMGQYFESCHAEEGGVGCFVSSNVTITSTWLQLNSAKRGGVFHVDMTSSFPTKFRALYPTSTFNTNQAVDVDEDGTDSGKGGVIYVKGAMTTTDPLVLMGAHYEKNTASFGNDVFVESAALTDGDPMQIANCRGESYSEWPHLEIEGRNSSQDEIDQISDFLPYPTVQVSNKSGQLTTSCRWDASYCKTLVYALQFVQSTYPNGTLYRRKAVLHDTHIITDPIVLDSRDFLIVGYQKSRYNTLSLPATLDDEEGIMFLIPDISRMSTENMTLVLKAKHHAVKVTSSTGRFEMFTSGIYCARDDTVIASPIWSVGGPIVLNSVELTSVAVFSTFSVPLIYFAPTPIGEEELCSGSIKLIECNMSYLIFVGTTMFELKTQGEITFTSPRIKNFTSDQPEGQYVSLTGHNLKTQLKPELWDETLQTAAHLWTLWGEDISMDLNATWRTGPLVYWLVSPSSEVVIGDEKDAVDHPNCGSSTFKCRRIDSAIGSAGLNKLNTISLSVTATLSAELSFVSSFTLKSLSEDKQRITFDKKSSLTINESSSVLSLTSLIFTVAETCSSPTLFVVEEGEMNFSSSIRLRVGSTDSFTGTSKVADITSNGTGSHVLIETSADLGSPSIPSLVSKFKPWEPTTTNGARFTKAEINEFVVVDEDGTVDELIYHWHPYDNKTLSVDRSGGTHSNCGLYELPCSSLSANVGKVGAGEVIVVSSNLTEAVGFISSKALSVESPDNTHQILSVAKTASFAIRSAPLSFTFISFIPLLQTTSLNTDTNTRTESLFIVESGSLSLTSCSVSSFELSSSPLITHTSGSLILNACNVSSITRSTGNGTVLSIEMKTGKSLLLNMIQFSSISSSKESPILALSFPPFDESTPDPLFSFTLTNLHFLEKNENGNEESCFISLVGHNLASWIGVGDDRFENSYDEHSELDHFWSFDESIELSASLLFYLLPSTGPVGVSSSGYNSEKCGSNSVWCSTIELSLTRLTPQNTKKIVVMDEVTLSTSISLPDELTFAGNPNALSTCVVSPAGSFVSEDIDSTSISKLTFSLPSTQTAEAVIVHSSTTLILSHLVLSSTAESSACFLKVTAGTSEISDIEIRSEMAQNSVLFSVFGGTVTASQLKVEIGIPLKGTIVQIEGGSLSLTGMTATSSKTMEGRPFSVNNAAFNLTDVKLSKQTFTNALFEFSSFEGSTISDMNISECSGWTIMTVNDGDSLTIRNSVFSSLTLPTSFNEVDTSDLCGWESSLIQIEGTPTSLSHIDFTQIPQGAISISDAPLTLTACHFSNNSPSNLEWPSLRRNIKCTNGTIEMDAVHGGDGPSTPHLWIWTDECAVTKDGELQHSTLFVPTLLTNKSTSMLNKKLKEYSVTVVGTMMIPCGLSLEVFEEEAFSMSNEGHPLRLDISSLQPSKWTEIELSFILPQSSLADMNKKSDIRCRLVFGDGQTTDSFSLIGKGKGNMSQGGVVTTIVVPIVAVIIVAVLLIIVIAVLCRRRKSKKQAAEKNNEELDVADAGDVLKDEGDAQDNTIKPIFGSTGTTNNSLLMVSEDKQHGEHVHTLGTPSVMSVKYVDAVKCDGEPGVVSVDATHTLYHRLHVEKARVVEKKKMTVRIVTGLERMMADHPSSELLSKLSPHWIILDFNQNTFLRIESISQLLASDGMHPLSASTKNEEDRRWNAPEQDSKDGGTANEQAEQYDRNKAAVFRLGLVLWELETGQVPFGELDAVNASRQIKAGVVPLIHNWEDQDFADLVTECLSLSPDSRPTLADVKTRLSELKSDAPPAAHDPLQQNEAAKAVSGMETS
ncbi:hypothetical protein BLNAU_6618 [Blattamonas nauphoetae]|uniref:Protein kinase domain-containing protein n=1 Tax=Blattamonas nauphoetae TaxID=2049346 RepID=A0ABQ9Y3M3_9EUKA|nr:hypothetical protein BLNAU_6618 [Blattamonas nauphoetae]